MRENQNDKLDTLLGHRPFHPPIRTCRSELFSKRSAYDELNSAAGEAESVLIFRKQAEWQSATNARRRLG